MSIKATCPCGAVFRTSSDLAGKRVKCPTCGQPTTVPPPASASPTIRVECECGKVFQVKSELAGKRVKCSSCGQAVTIHHARRDSALPGSGLSSGDPLAGSQTAAAGHRRSVDAARPGDAVSESEPTTNATGSVKRTLPAGYRIEERPDRLIITRRGVKDSLIWLCRIGCLFFICAFPLMYVALLEGGLMPLLFAGLVMPIISVVVFVYVWKVHRTTIEIDRESISIRRGPLPWPGKTIAVGTVEQFYCTKQHHPRDPSQGFGRSFDTYLIRVLTKQGRRLTLLSGFDSTEDACHVEAAIEDFLGIVRREVDLSSFDRLRASGSTEYAEVLLLAVVLLGAVLGFHEYGRSWLTSRAPSRAHRATPAAKKLEPRSFSNKRAAEVSSEGLAGNAYALEFNGQSSHISIPRLRYDGSYALTLEAWIRPSSSKAGDIIGNMQNAGIAFGVAEDRCVVTTHNGRDHIRLEAGKLVHGREVHVAGVFDGVTIKIFVNGQLQGEKQFRGLYKRSSLAMIIGGNPEQNKPPIFVFSGIIDEVRMSSTVRYAASFSPQRRFTPDEYTVALYHFDAGSGDVAKDSSGNGFDGKIVGATWVDVGTTQESSSSQ